MTAPLIKEINSECSDAFDNFRLKCMKYSSLTNECEIFLNYRKKEGQDHRDFEKAARLILPSCIKYRFRYAMVGAHETAIVIAVRTILSERFKISTVPDSVRFNGTAVSITLPTEQFCRCIDEKAKAEIADALDSEFCRSFEIEFFESAADIDPRDIAGELADGIRENMIPTLEAGRRVIQPFNIEKYIGDLVEPPAAYISDVRTDPDEKTVLCGKLTNVRLDTRNSAKNPGKTFTIFRAVLTDFTGSIGCFSFVSDANLPKYQELDVSSAVIACGIVDRAYNSDDAEFKISRLSYCELPKEFEEQVFKKGAPNKYRVLRPQPFAVVRQSNLFEQAEESHIDPFLLGKTFVVFDTETTGIRASDKIVEIACVKIVDGKIVEHMETLVDPETHIPEDATRVNHITDAMIAGAPRWHDVVADIYKFCDGAVLVGHNVAFDMRMLNGTSRETHFYFENATLDTMSMARKKVHNVHNYTLSTLLQAFGLINENAHRALADTVATAQLFMKLLAL